LGNLAQAVQVTELQHFLSDYYDLNPDDYVTGYFGRKTRNNVRKFQCETMNICSGDESTTGYGLVGRKTRDAIKAHCGVQTTTNTNTNNPPPAPTCSLNANPSSITLGQSSTLTWSSTNATQGSISTIGTVSPNGSQSVSPTLTTTYLGTFWGTGGTATCNTTVSVITTNTNYASCIFNNQTIPDSQSVTAYQSSTVPAGQQCVSQTRTCQNGTLTGSYQYATCAPLTASCTPNWSCTSWSQCSTYGSQTRSCSDTNACGTTAGKPAETQSCTPPPPQCTREQPQTQTLSCPAGQTGSITQTRTSTCPGPTWGPWTTTSNTCVTTTGGTGGTGSLSATPISGPAILTVTFTASYPYFSDEILDPGDGSGMIQISYTGSPRQITRTYNTGTYTAKLYATANPGAVIGQVTITVGAAEPPIVVSACTYKGQTVSEGTQETVPFQHAIPLTSTAGYPAVCDGGLWVLVSDVLGGPPNNLITYPAGLDVCPALAISSQDFGCPGTYGHPAKETIAAVPRHGRAPLTMQVRINNCESYGLPFTISWGDGSNEQISATQAETCYWRLQKSHTYASPGTYQMSYTAMGNIIHYSNIRVDGPVASAGNQSQLASALVALQSALQALLQLLK
jgi:hypothetical protein